MTRVKFGIFVAIAIAVLTLAKGVGLIAFVFYRWLRRTVPAESRSARITRRNRYNA